MSLNINKQAAKIKEAGRRTAQKIVCILHRFEANSRTSSQFVSKLAKILSHYVIRKVILN